ncbi:hypothetical protein DFJ73DRAFT_293085 [Zopfochytrium polystomum]|nr:hypothetical protein DFJ73DRAFT_293085 [Zopfochytrium polystomum]
MHRDLLAIVGGGGGGFVRVVHRTNYNGNGDSNNDDNDSDDNDDDDDYPRVPRHVVLSSFHEAAAAAAGDSSLPCGPTTSFDHLLPPPPPSSDFPTTIASPLWYQQQQQQQQRLLPLHHRSSSSSSYNHNPRRFNVHHGHHHRYRNTDGFVDPFLLKQNAAAAAIAAPWGAGPMVSPHHPPFSSRVAILAPPNSYVDASVATFTAPMASPSSGCETAMAISSPPAEEGNLPTTEGTSRHRPLDPRRLLVLQHLWPSILQYTQDLPTALEASKAFPLLIPAHSVRWLFSDRGFRAQVMRILATGQYDPWDPAVTRPPADAMAVSPSTPPLTPPLPPNVLPQPTATAVPPAPPSTSSSSPCPPLPLWSHPLIAHLAALPPPPFAPTPTATPPALPDATIARLDSDSNVTTFLARIAAYPSHPLHNNPSSTATLLARFHHHLSTTFTTASSQSARSAGLRAALGALSLPLRPDSQFCKAYVRGATLADAAEVAATMLLTTRLFEFGYSAWAANRARFEKDVERRVVGGAGGPEGWVEATWDVVESDEFESANLEVYFS